METLQLPSVEAKTLTFSWYDYAMFAIMLGVSILTGVYYGCFGTKQATASEYLLGNRKMKLIPIAGSLLASYLSGVALVAVPTDIYKNGANYFWMPIATIFSYLVTSYAFLPMFVNLKITSTYEYLEKRFDYKVRSLASMLFALLIIMQLPIVIYIPALIFEAVTDINVHLVTSLMCGVCIFYTTIGGIKAVVWTDIIQISASIVATIMVLILGFIKAGGVGKVWTKSMEGHRLDIFNFDFDPTNEDTFWTIIIGFGVILIGNFNAQQGFMQKMLSLPTLDTAKRALLLFAITFLLFNIITVFSGMILYTLYGNCDLLSTGRIKRNDQIVPYYVMDVAGKIPGLPGLFVVGVFAASLSTLSSHLNCVAATIYEDFVSKLLRKSSNESQSSNILKLIVVIVGSICTGLVLVIEKLGDMWPVYNSFEALATGQLLGLFILGAFVPKANTKGALCGSIFGLTVMSWIIFSAQYYNAKMPNLHPTKPLSTDECSFLLNTTTTTKRNSSTTDEFQSPPFVLYRIAFPYFTMMGATLTTATGVAISYVTNKKDPPVDKQLLSPLIHRFILERKPNGQDKYDSVYEAVYNTTLNVK